MQIVDEHGLSIAMITPDEFLDAPWTRAAEPIDVVRMPDPPPELWGSLVDREFIRKPNTLTWLARLGADESGYLAGLSKKPRQLVRRAQRQAADKGLLEIVEDRIEARTIDQFLALYEDRVAQLRYGVAYGLRHREAILNGPPKYFGVFCYEAGELAGGCLVLECPEEDAIRIRFSAVTEEWRRASLSRALYFTAMRVAREKGYTWATLGDEWNLYGHITEPGLFTFKAEMGFEAVASQDFADPTGSDEADLILRLTTLSDPSMVLGYSGTGEAGVNRLHAHVFSNSQLDVDRYSAPFLSGITVTAPAIRRNP